MAFVRAFLCVSVESKSLSLVNSMCMTILIQKALIKDIHSPYHNTVADLFLSNGKIVDVSEQINTDADKIINAHGLMLSPGWTDIFVGGSDPGYEFKDDLNSLSASAAIGGFTHIWLTPNTKPVTQTKAGIQYIVDRKTSLPVALHPIGAVTKDTLGKELTEMFDMKQSGAVAFGDGSKSIQSSGLLIKALQYVKAFDGLIVQVPDDQTIAPHGLMHEGIVSTQVGLPGKPALSEEIMLSRDIALLRYTDSKLHITGISLASSVEMIRQAKLQGLNITCSTTPYHLMFTDASFMSSYNTLLKVNPPLRTEQDRVALIDGIKDGTIDCVTTHHTAQNKDAKVCEFEYAEYGMLGLESVYGVLASVGFSTDEILSVLCFNPAVLFGSGSKIENGAFVDLTLFDPSIESRFSLADIKSKSINSPYIGMDLKGKVVATFYNEQFNIL